MSFLKKEVKKTYNILNVLKGVKKKEDKKKNMQSKCVCVCMCGKCEPVIYQFKIKKTILQV